MKHGQLQAAKINPGAGQVTLKRKVAPIYRGPYLGILLQAKLCKPDTPPTSPSSFLANTMKTRLRLVAWPYEVMKPEALAELDRLASKGASTLELVDVMDIDFAELHEFRYESQWFDDLINGLEYRAAYVRLFHGQ
jgi:hypothetical protein